MGYFEKPITWFGFTVARNRQHNRFDFIHSNLTVLNHNQRSSIKKPPWNYHKENNSYLLAGSIDRIGTKRQKRALVPPSINRRSKALDNTNPI